MDQSPRKTESQNVDRFWPYQILALHDEAGVLTIELEDDQGKTLQVRWSFFFVYRKMDDGLARRSFEAAQPASDARCWIAEVHESAFTRWFGQEVCDTVNVENLIHFRVISSNDVCDVLALEAPVVVVDGMPKPVPESLVFRVRGNNRL